MGRSSSGPIKSRSSTGAGGPIVSSSSVAGSHSHWWRCICNGSEAEWLTGGHSSGWIPPRPRRSRALSALPWGMTAAARAVVAVALAAILSTPAPQAADTFSNIPPTLSGGSGKQERIKHPKSAKALQCTTKCVGTCIRGGAGEGPLNVRRPLVVFKDGFRTRQYCLIECSDICNRIKDGKDGP